MRIMRFELIRFAWKAKNLPLIYIRIYINFSKEKVGFEPTMLFNILVFKTNALNLSTIYPIIKFNYKETPADKVIIFKNLEYLKNLGIKPKTLVPNSLLFLFKSITEFSKYFL